MISFPPKELTEAQDAAAHDARIDREIEQVRGMLDELRRQYAHDFQVHADPLVKRILALRQAKRLFPLISPAAPVASACPLCGHSF